MSGGGAGLGLVLAAFGIRVAFYLIRQKNAPPPAGSTTAAPMPDDPRWGASRGEQVTGRACAECELKIALEADGRFCKTCHAPVHKKACAKRHRALAHRPKTEAGPYR
jgi:hypothetical protein